jgi:hypothetical protein
MKKYIIFLIGTISVIATGCSNFLEEDLRGKVFADTAISNEAGLDGALTGAYAGLGKTWGIGFINGAPTDVSLGADDITCPSTAAPQNEFETLNVSSASTISKPMYDACYKTIQGANTVIGNYEKVPGNAANIKVMGGEAYFLRALGYFYLVRYFKDIPLITEYTPEFSNDLLDIKKSPPLDIYKLIEADLLKSEVMLGNTKRDLGRPNKGSAKALLADLYQTWAGWPLKDVSKYALAAAKAKEVIDNKALYGFDLVSTYAELFANDPAKVGSASLIKEDVFAIATNKTNATTTSTVQGAYWMPGRMGGWDIAYSEINFYNNFPDGARKNATFATTYKYTDGTIITDWNNLDSKHPYYKKMWINAANPTAGFESSFPVKLIRYAHVLTIYAESKARSSAPDQQAYDCLNAIRSRAGLTPYVFGSLTAADFADKVVQERSWEFAAENNRFFDLVRLEKVKEANSNRNSRETPLDAATITEADYTFAIPFSDVLINPNLN